MSIWSHTIHSRNILKRSVDRKNSWSSRLVGVYSKGSLNTWHGESSREGITQ